MSTAEIIAGFIASTIGLGIFVYGKKQQRPPQLVAGALLMACPFFAPAPLWTALLSAALVGGLWLAVRAGW